MPIEQIPPPRVQAEQLAKLSQAFAPEGTDPIEVERPALYAVYASDVAVRLQSVWTGREVDPASCYIVIAVTDKKAGYITCRLSGARELEMEASAGAYPPTSGQPVPYISAKMARALEEHSFYKDQHGRFLCRLDIWEDPNPDVWGAASVGIVDCLIDVFGARASSHIEIVAPLAPHRDEAAIRQFRGETDRSSPVVMDFFEDVTVEFPNIDDNLLEMASSEFPGVSADEAALGIFYALHMNDLQDRLARIHASPEPDPEQRQLVVTPMEGPRHSVRAQFDTRNGLLRVEPLGGANEAGDFTLRLNAKMRAEDFEQAAIAILDFLVDSFEVSPRSEIKITAPLAPERDDRAMLALIMRSDNQEVEN